MDLQYRTLARSEIARLDELDRTESVDQIYYARDGALVLEDEHWDVPDWSPTEKQRRIAALQEDYDRGATVFGAFAGPLLAGMAVLNHHPLPSGVDRLQLAGLWVSHPYRGQGVGTTLVRLVKRAARERGARTLYVSATPSENTVRFYRGLGFQPTAAIDPDLYEEEPEDIHMELRLEA